MTQLTTPQIDALLPELPSLVRLIIARDLTEENELLAIDCDSKRQCGITRREAYAFIPDCLGLDPTSAATYTQGYPIDVGMTRENWTLWLAQFESVGSDHEWLTVCRDGANDDCISALCLTSKREVIAPPDKFRSFVLDLKGFNADRFNEDYSVVCRIRSSDWFAWLEMFEVADLDAETIALLSEAE